MWSGIVYFLNKTKINNMKKFAIKGDISRGDKIIDILKMMGGKHEDMLCSGNYTDLNYTIDKEGLICCFISDNPDFVIFTLDEFIDKFPFKVGDKVNSPCKGCVKTITSMKWDEYLESISYKLDDKIYTNIDLLKVNNSLHLNEISDTPIDFVKESDDRFRIVLNYQYDMVVDEGEYYAVKRK